MHKCNQMGRAHPTTAADVKYASSRLEMGQQILEGVCMHMRSRYRRIEADALRRVLVRIIAFRNVELSGEVGSSAWRG